MEAFQWDTLVFSLLAAVIYTLPTWIALARGLQEWPVIACVNCFGGFFVLPWITALFAATERDVTVVRRDAKLIGEGKL